MIFGLLQPKNEIFAACMKQAKELQLVMAIPYGEPIRALDCFDCSTYFALG